MYHGRYVKVQVGRRIITMWDGQTTIAFEDSHDAIFIRQMLKAFSQTKKIKAQEIRNLEHLGISDNKLLRELVKYKFYEFVKEKDQTEVGEKKQKKTKINNCPWREAGKRCRNLSKCKHVADIFSFA